MKSLHPPKRPTEDYRQNLVWLKAFQACGWSGMRAVIAAEKALNEYLQKNKKPRLIS